MSRKEIWPYGDADFNLWYKNLMQQVSLNTAGDNPVWKHIPKDEVDAFVSDYHEWYTVYATCLVPHVPSVTKAKNDMRDISEKRIRRFKRLFLNSDFITNAQRVDMRLPIRKERSPVQRPPVACEGDLVFPAQGLIEVVGIRPAAGIDYEKRSLYIAEIAWGISPSGKSGDKFPLAAIPLTGADLPHSAFTRKRKLRFDLQGESGNSFYACLRYQNAKTEAGPWGPVLKAVIP